MAAGRSASAALTTAFALLCASGAAAQNNDVAAQRGDQLAYGYAMTCFVANGVVLGDYQKRGDSVDAASSDGKARRSFDTATALGAKLGFSGDRINQDFGLVQARELPRMVSDPAYFRKAATTCKALGLM
jgi:hypothetical protein